MNDIKTGTISITGLAELEKRMLDFPDKLARNILAGGIRAGAAVIRGEAVSRAPKLTGEMAKDILIKRARGKGIEFHVYVRSGRRSRLAGKKRNVNRDSFYWRFVEFGTSKMAAQPFMRPAFEAKKQEAVEAIRDYLAQRIDKEAAK